MKHWRTHRHRLLLWSLTVLTAGGFVLGAAGCGSSAGDEVGTSETPTKLHPIHEPFGGKVLPCPKNPTSTVEIEGCLEKTILSTDRRIQRQASTILHLLRPSARSSFATAEKLWLEYRSALCKARGSLYEGGTARPGEYAVCVIDLNRSHIRELLSMRSALQEAAAH
jgi:uncharacterized protein YecT (DUF1311 family)